MDKNLNAWNDMPPPVSEFSSLHSVNNLKPQAVPQQSSIQTVIPTHGNPHECAHSSSAASPFSGLQDFKSSQNASGFPVPVNQQPGFAAAQSGVLVFDLSIGPTSLIFSSSSWSMIQAKPGEANPHTGCHGSNSNGIDIVADNGGEEMHEDTEEIDALLYSDSENYVESDEEVASTGHSPVEMGMPMGSMEEISSSNTPTKKRPRLDLDMGASVVAKTSSEIINSVKDNLYYSEDDGVSSCVAGGANEEARGVPDSRDRQNRGLKRKRIHETVDLLRRIIPGGKGKDAATVLEEAIGYLKSLKLKAKAMGATML